MPAKRRRSSETSNASSPRSSMSPIPPVLEPVPTVDDDGVALAPGAPHSNVQHFYQRLIGEGRVLGFQPGNGYTMDDIKEGISSLTKNHIQITKGIMGNHNRRTLWSADKKKERNEGLRIDFQGRTTRYAFKCHRHQYLYTEFNGMIDCTP